MLAGGVYAGDEIRAGARFHNITSHFRPGFDVRKDMTIVLSHDQDFAGWRLFMNSIRNFEPFMSGIDTSTRTTSGASRAASRMASVPFFAWPQTTHPRCYCSSEHRSFLT
jgi:hypothetical protein